MRILVTGGLGYIGSHTCTELSKNGYEIVIVSWLSKQTTAEYDKAVTQAKLQWLKSHLPSVEWNDIIIVPHGTPKHELCSGVLFDDEQYNREMWGENAFEPSEILNFLRGLR